MSAQAAAPRSKGPALGWASSSRLGLEQLAVPVLRLGHPEAPVALPGQVAAAGRASRQWGFPGKLSQFALLLGQKNPV